MTLSDQGGKIQRLKDEFSNIFPDEADSSEIRIFSAPGRANIIGEHTDYNGGFVLPFAIDRYIFVAVRKRRDKKFRLFSFNFPDEPDDFLSDELFCEWHKAVKWSDYPKGVIRVLLDEGFEFHGADIIFYGDIPPGAGLSSSAALEVATCFAISEVFSLKIPRKQIALLSQKAENQYVGVMCGIMDQFASSLSKKEHALFINCKTDEFEYVKSNLKDTSFVIVNTKVKRELALSEYNRRRWESQMALSEVKKYVEVEVLSDLSPDDFRKIKSSLPELLRKRVEHIIYENERVKKALVCLEEGVSEELGELLFSSHDSLKTLYEVSSPELDFIVEEGKKIDGVFGVRMMGAGFGGSAIALIHKSQVESFIKETRKRYKEKFGISPDFFVCRMEQGVRELQT